MCVCGQPLRVRVTRRSPPAPLDPVAFIFLHLLRTLILLYCCTTVHIPNPERTDLGRRDTLSIQSVETLIEANQTSFRWGMYMVSKIVLTYHVKPREAAGSTTTRSPLPAVDRPGDAYCPTPMILHKGCLAAAILLCCTGRIDCTPADAHFVHEVL